MRAVAVRVLDADFSKEVVSMREWLDRHHCEPARFVYDQADNEVVVLVELQSEHDAEAFALRFNGQRRATGSKP